MRSISARLREPAKKTRAMNGSLAFSSSRGRQPTTQFAAPFRREGVDFAIGFAALANPLCFDCAVGREPVERPVDLGLVCMPEMRDAADECPVEVVAAQRRDREHSKDCVFELHNPILSCIYKTVQIYDYTYITCLFWGNILVRVLDV